MRLSTAVQRRLTPRIVDLLVTGAVVAGTLLPPLLWGPREAWIVALGLLASVPLIWRRRAPIGVALVAGSAITALALLGQAPPLPYGALVATYPFASLSPPFWRVAAALVTAFAVAVSLALPRETRN